ncbi:hypothetical protein SeMB42_g01081 [Synchytrium endobioticum]|uniref:Uncharacterized protein n=1 Tax=Synchytrium endobioticum TaxID=286115 RepID=A0A507D494_9FUNG|nr:hypothetical protein SeLEV6574_g03427 [Synchytrium endobioticum]TPX52974.1 hypothetical protein SeMB42_g01081 [Synchytrium endobioticum]
MLQGSGRSTPGFETFQHYQPKWVPTSGNNIPGNAFPGGKDADGQVLYVARAFINGSVQPGKAGREMNPPGAHIPWDGREHTSPDFDVMILPSDVERYYRWIPATEGVTSLMSMKKEGRVLPVVAGYEPDGRELYVAQCFHDDSQGRSLHPGKFGAHTPAGLYAYGGKEKHSNSFNVLVFDTTMLPGGGMGAGGPGYVGAGGGGPQAPTSGPTSFANQGPGGGGYRPPGSTGQGGYNPGQAGTGGSNFSGSSFSAPIPGGGYMTAHAGHGVPGGSAVSYTPGPPPQSSGPYNPREAYAPYGEHHHHEHHGHHHKHHHNRDSSDSSDDCCSRK